MPAELVTIPIGGSEVTATEVDGQHFVILRPAIEVLGLTYSAQAAKLRGKSWATVVEIDTVGADGRNRQMTAVDVRTFLMLLATVSENKVAKDLQPVLQAFQSQVADVIEAYFTKGGAINPNATPEQTDRLSSELSAIKMRAEIVHTLRGVVAADYLDAKGRILLGQAMGEVAVLDESKRPLYVQSYLSSRGMSASEVKASSSQFGKLMRAQYFIEHGDHPPKAPQEIGGRVIDVYAYTETDRYLFDRVWMKHYSKVGV